jgi:hypothetical protein
MSRQVTVGGVDFSGETFVVKSALVGTDYVIKTGDGRELVRARRSYFADTLEYSYTDGDGETIFRYERATQEEAPVRFRLVEKDTTTPLATLEPEDESSWSQWRLETPNETGGPIYIEGKSGRIPFLTPKRGRRMEITGADDQQIGSVNRRTLAVHFMFDVELPGVSDVAKPPLVLAVPMLYDAMREKGSAPWLP